MLGLLVGVGRVLEDPRSRGNGRSGTREARSQANASCTRFVRSDGARSNWRGLRKPPHGSASLVLTRFALAPGNAESASCDVIQLDRAHPRAADNGTQRCSGSQRRSRVPCTKSVGCRCTKQHVGITLASGLPWGCSGNPSRKRPSAWSHVGDEPRRDPSPESDAAHDETRRQCGRVSTRGR